MIGNYFLVMGHLMFRTRANYMRVIFKTKLFSYIYSNTGIYYY